MLYFSNSCLRMFLFARFVSAAYCNGCENRSTALLSTQAILARELCMQANRDRVL